MRADCQGEARRHRIGASAGGRENAVGQVVPGSRRPPGRRASGRRQSGPVSVARPRAADPASARRGESARARAAGGSRPRGAQALRPARRRPLGGLHRVGSAGRPRHRALPGLAPRRSRSGPISSTRRSGRTRASSSIPNRRRARIATGPSSKASPFFSRRPAKGTLAALEARSGSLRRRAPRRLGGQGHLAAPGRQQRRPRRARSARRAARPSPGRREAGGAGAPARLEQAAHGEGAQEAHARTCPRSTASSSRTSSRSSRTSSATRCSSSARTTSASISSRSSGGAARWRRTASASRSATSTSCGSSRPRSAFGTSTRTRGASTS